MRLVVRMAGALVVATVLVVGYAALARHATAGTGNQQDPRKAALLNSWKTPQPGQATPALKTAGHLLPCGPLPQPRDAGQIVWPDKHGYPVPFNGALYRITTLWRVVRNNQLMVVYAGEDRVSTPVGMIDVLTANQCLMKGNQHEYRSRLRNVALVLTAVNGDVVSFRYPAGTGKLDIRTGKFSFR